MRNIIYSPLASLVFFVMGNAFFMTFMTVKLRSMEVATSIMGLIHSTYYIGMLLGAIRSEAIINRVGHIRAFSSFASIMAISFIIQAFFYNPITWSVARFLAGFATSALYVIIESWLLAQSTKKTKGKILSIYMVCLYVSQSISQFFIDIVDLDTVKPFMLAVLLLVIAIIPASLTYMKAPDLETEHGIRINKYFNASPLGFIGCVLAGLIISAIYSFVPLYAEDMNLSVSMTVGITIAGGFVLQWPIGKLSDIFDRAIIITLLAVFVALVSLIIALSVCHPYIMYLLFFLLGGGCFTIYPVSIAQVCDHLEGVSIVNITGSLLFAYGIGSIFGPFIISMLLSIWSSVAIFYYIMITAMVLTIYGIYTYLRIKPVAEEQQVDFVALPTETPIANNLDPRIEG